MLRELPQGKTNKHSKKKNTWRSYQLPRVRLSGFRDRGGMKMFGELTLGRNDSEARVIFIFSL